jgi:hypothetical protein
MSPDMKNLTNAKLKYMINNTETFDLYNTKSNLGGPSTTSRKKANSKTFKMESALMKYDMTKGESNINDRSDKNSLNTTFN